MNNHKLSKSIAELLGLSVRSSQKARDCVSINITNTFGYHDVGFVDYCNNMNDLMPLVFEYEISLDMTNGIAGACLRKRTECGEFINESCHSESRDPQRALAECLYKVLKEKLNNE